MRPIVALFGEAEKGQFQVPYLLKDMPQLMDCLGHPPDESEGLFFAIQTLLFKRDLIFFRVEAEGFSESDYFSGLKYLQKIQALQAICLPGVGDPKIIHACQPICHIHRSCLITTQKDLYDYLTNL